MKTAFVVLATAFTFIFHCNVAKGHEYITKTTPNATDHENYLAITERFRYAEKFSKNVMNTVFKKILPYVYEYSEKINISKECMKNGMHLIFGIKNIKKWAFQFLDATGKIPDGMMSGSIYAVGHYDQCLDIKVKSTRKQDLGELLYQGQYCTIEVRSIINLKKPQALKMLELPEELKEYLKTESVFVLLARYINYVSFAGLRIGACLPTGCTTDDINSVLQLVGQIVPIINVTALRCEKREENNYTPSVILVLTFYALICFLVLAGSIVDIFFSDTLAVKRRITKALLAFSLITNFKRFCAPNKHSDTVSCLNGMKFFGLTWVVLGHTFIAGLLPYTHGYLKFIENRNSLAFQAVLNAMFVVDTFFIIGSFLVAYLTTKYIIQQKKKFSVLKYIVHRLLRLYPTYIALLSTIVLLPLINSGPFWKEIMDIQLDPCFKNWWANLLFISNFYQPTEMCFIHTWYITVDIQLYILSLLFLLPLIRWPKIGLTLICLGIIGHLIFCGITTYVYEWPPVVLYTLMNLQETQTFLAYMYYSPFTHLGPYGVGLLLGYICAMNRNIKMSRKMQILGWCVAFTCSFSVLYGSRGWYLRTMPQYLTVIYASLSKIAWSIGPAWLIFCCATGHGGIINWLLSWRIFTHLGRLTFSAYLIHLIPVTLFYSGLKTRVQPDLYMSIWFFAGSLCASLSLGFLLHMFIEVPFVNLERVFLLDAAKEPESIAKEKNIDDKGYKAENNGDIIISPPFEENICTKL